jgi:hypothetical protein
MAEIDPRLTKNVETVERGFQVIVGHAWEIANKNTEETVDWLRLVFLPLVKAAASANVYVRRFTNPLSVILTFL